MRAATVRCLALAAAAVFLGCDTDLPTTGVSEGAAMRASASTLTGNGVETARLQQGLRDLRRWSAPFHDLDAAMDYGYTVNVGCISDPERGGMGHHYTRGDVDLVGDGEVDLLEPEFLVYMTDQSGELRFAAFDYFVPFGTWDVEEQEGPPSLLGIDFHREETFQAWVLHIWLWWHNPAGTFEDYNPDVPLCG